MSDHEVMQVERMAIADLVLDDRNARKGNVGVIAESLREFGQHRPAVVQRGTKKVVVGNHMIEAARFLGWTHVDVTFVDDDDIKAQRRSLADNATNDKAGWDDQLLGELLSEVGPVPGYDEQAVERLLRSLNTPEADEAVYPIVAKPNEKYDYVLIVATSEMDVAWLYTKLQLREEKSYKRDRVALSHVLTVSRVQEVLGG